MKIKNKNMRCVRPTWKWIFIMLTYANLNIKKNMTRLWCKILPKIGVEQIEKNEGFYIYLYPFEDLV
jgi:hypothetical protein